MAVLAHLQHDLEELHGSRCALDVGSFMVDDAARGAIPGSDPEIDEQLFVREDTDAIAMGLYIAPAVVAQLEADNPWQRLHDGNIEAYCIALEGISHFVVVAWRATAGWPVSLLEMEIQAEVDKFTSAWMLLVTQGAVRHRVAPHLLRLLFERCVVHSHLPAPVAARYRHASVVAQRYCTRLARCYGRDPDDRRIRRDVRDFFRKALGDKIRAG